VVPGRKRGTVVDLDLPVGIPPERFLTCRGFPQIHGMPSMPERDDHKKISSCRAGLLDHVARALAMAERRFRRADQLDYVIRRRLFPTSEASIRRSGLSDIQDAIGQCLCEQYAPERSMPARLANLLREYEQRSNKPEAFA
jgi:hypothetical protein